jgi:hypothetical protein
MEEARRLWHRERLEGGRLAGVRLGPLMNLAGRPGEAAEVQLLEFPAQRAPGLAGRGLDDLDQELRRPAPFENRRACCVKGQRDFHLGGQLGSICADT